MDEIDYDDQFFQAFKAGYRQATSPMVPDRDVWDAYMEWISE